MSIMISRAPAFIAARREFCAGPLRGTTSYDGLGQLHPAYDALAVSAADFIVYSYATPIAWCIGGRWVVPCEHYPSAVTTRHQDLVRNATKGA